MATINGTPNADPALNGTAGDDTINGLGGNDKIDGAAGNDQIDGGAGNDVIKGGDGNDIITGGANNDTIVGGAGQDTALYLNTTIAAASAGGSPIGSWSGALLTLVTGGVDGTDLLNQVESLNFNGQTFAVNGYNGTSLPYNVIANLGADSASVAQSGANTVSGQVLANDYDVDSLLTVTGARTPPLAAPGQAIPLDPKGPQADPSMDVTGAYGTLHILADGTYTYTADGSGYGVDHFQYSVTDGGITRWVNLDITVTHVNRAPVASQGSNAGDEDSAISGSVSASDADHDSLTYSVVSGPQHGSLDLHSDGTYTYTPDANYHGPDSFEFKANDGTVDSNSSTVNLYVNPVNDVPVTYGGSGAGSEDGIISGWVSASDADGDSLAYSLVSGPSHGSVTIYSNGQYLYTPDANYHGSDSFSFKVNDGTADSNISTVSLNVSSVNDVPTTSGGNNSTNEDTAVTGQVYGSDADNDTLTYSVVSGPQHGSLDLHSDGTYTYTPDADYHGSDSFSFRANDGTANSTTSTVNLTVNSVNDAPTASAGSNSTNEDTAVSGSVAGGDADSDPLTFSVVTGPSHGSLDLHSDGTYTYTPDANYHGSDSFTFKSNDGTVDSAPATITLNVSSVNDTPVAADGSASTNEDTLVSGSVHATDADNDSLTYAVASGPQHGSLSLGSDGTYTYTPNANYHGSDSFDFSVSDGHGGTDYGHVAINVASVNDVPTASGGSNSTNEDTAVSGSVHGSDIDNDPLTYSLVSGPSHGSLDLHSDGTYTYTPDADYHGSDSFSFKVNDGAADSSPATVTLNVNSVNDLPVALNGSGSAPEDTVISGSVHATDADNDSLTYSMVSGPSHGSLDLHSDGTYTYTPDADYHGTDSFQFQANDGQGNSNTATVSLNVAPPVNDGTIAQNGSVSTNEDTAVSGSASATDVDGDPLTYSLVNGPAHGSVSFNSDGSYTYTPDANYHGSDSFTFKANDGTADSNVATISLNVTSVNDLPVASGASFSTNEDTSATGSVHATDADNDALTYSVVGNPAHGSLSLGSDGTYTYIPNANYHGSDSFTYQANDGQGYSNTATVTINVNSVNDVPVASGASFNTNEDTAVSGAVHATDADGDSLTYSLYSGGGAAPQGSSAIQLAGVQHGSLDFHSDGTFTYTPSANYHGSDSFQYRAYDGQAYSAPVTVYLNVSSVNDLPVASGASFSTNEDTSATGSVHATDADNDALTYSVVGNPAHGSLSLGSDGTYTYTPNANYHGSDSFTYRANDGTGNSNTATVTINVNSVNDVPVASGGFSSTNEDTAVSGSVHATDADGDSLTYSVVNGPSHGSLSFNSSGGYTYTPDANYHGSDSFTFKANDGTADSNTATVTLNVSSVNDVPVANAGGTFGFSEDQVISSQASGSDADNDTLTWSVVSGLDGLTFNPDGSWTFDPTGNATAQALNDGENASLSFTYRAYDGTAYSNTVTAIFQISGVTEVLNGTALRDVLNGSAYGDRISGLGGNDDLYGLGGNDTINGGDGADKLYGGDGVDILSGNDGNDTVNGDAGNDTLSGNAGADTMDGGDGVDTVDGGADNDVVKGGAGNDSVYGGDGNDDVQGGIGDDFVYGGAGADRLSGGIGADTFVFAAGDLTNSTLTSDTITDFKSAQGDILDLHLIDANSVVGGDQGFTFVGSAFTNHAGEMILSYNSGTNVTTLGLDTNGDGTADYVMQLTGNVNNPNGWIL